MSTPRSSATRRVFFGRSLTTTAVIMLMANARVIPALAEEVEEGTINRMGRIAFDPESKKTWISLLHVDVSTRQIETKAGSTRVSRAVDRIMISSQDLTPTSRRIDVSAGMPHAKLAPRISARAGRVGITWCGMDLNTKDWKVYASIFNDTPGTPVVVSSAGRDALHPDIALDPHSGQAFIVFEDWADGSIRLSRFDGRNWSEPCQISTGGRNYRPRLIITRADGKNRGSVAVSWDAYRNGQYDVFLRIISPDGTAGPEHRVTQSAEWDKDSSLAEDLDGNIWVAWVRAATELSNYDRLRTIHARFFDGEKWRWPMPPQGMTGNGRITGRTTTMRPSLLVDASNRVHLFYRDLEGPMWGSLYAVTYEGDRWTARREVRDKAIQDKLSVIWDYSIAIDDQDRALAVWDSLRVKRLGFDSVIHPPFPLPLPPKPARPFTTQGVEGTDVGGKAWPARTRPKAPSTKIGDKTCTLVFGDTHTHSWTSDGIDPDDWYFHYARDIVGLDYFALSDHDFTISNTPGLEAYISFLPKKFSRPDFVCFQAYEFSSQKTGHRVVVFEGNDRPTFSFTWPPRQESTTHEELYHFLHQFPLTPDSRVLVTAHNMVHMGNDFTGYDPGLEPLYDVSSLWALADKPAAERRGQSVAGEGGIWKAAGKVLDMGRSPEQKANWKMCWREGLDNGFMLGAYASSDTHAANAIGFVVSGLWVEKKDRRHIFDAIFARRSVAVDSGIRLEHCGVSSQSQFLKRNDDMLRPDLRFSLDGHVMGSAVSLNAHPVAEALVSSINPENSVHAVVIVKDGKDVARFPGENRSRVEVKWMDESEEAGRHYYYVRAEFARGKTAFSSPVFVSY